jgi:UDP-N-acetylglucosamine acyltransferase
MPQVHPTAIVDPQAELADDVIIGPYCIITGPVQIGAGTIIHPHSQLEGKTRIGKNCRIGPTAFIGQPPQHLRADPDIGMTIIGDRVTIREMTAVHRSITAGEEHATRIGDECFVMSQAHVGHDGVLEPQATIASGVFLGGHCHVGRNAFLGGGCVVHQFVRLGRLVIICGNEAVSQDVPPFGSMRYSGLKGYNAVGCRRSGMSAAGVKAVRAVYRCLHETRVMSRALERIEAEVGQVPEAREVIDFIRASKRGIVPSVRQHNPWGSGAGSEED